MQACDALIKSHVESAEFFFVPRSTVEEGGGVLEGWRGVGLLHSGGGSLKKTLKTCKAVVFDPAKRARRCVLQTEPFQSRSLRKPGVGSEVRTYVRRSDCDDDDDDGLGTGRVPNNATGSL